MSETKRLRIRRFRANILKDIQEDVIEDLKNIHVLSKLDIQQLNNVGNFKEKMELFLDIILEKPASDVEQFINALKIWYSWLYELINNPNNNIYNLLPLNKDLFRGGVPPLPHRNITRISLVDRIRNRIVDLNPNQYLVLHGMLGCGKTSLAIEAINCHEIRDICKGQILWLSVSSEGDKNILALQECLNSFLPDPEPYLPDDINVALIRLRLRFSKWEDAEDALIILDDVHSEQVIEYLSVGTKFLITTENQNIINDHRKSLTIFEKIPDGFEEEETLSVLASGLGVKVHDLPTQAKYIHQYTKGHPMIVSLISAQLEDHKEQAKADSSRWDYYVKLFSDKQLKRRSFDEHSNLNNAIRMSIESMSKQKIKYFHYFVLFVEDVNIKPEVLAICWSMDKHEVENVMMEFVRKSLIVRNWNPALESFVYGIHDLILRYLTNNLDTDYVKSLHKHFIESYMHTCNGDLSKLNVEDNYIYYYIGRHLKLASMYDLFPKLYFNLEFIEMKLKKAGPADVILDFKRYEDLIIGSNINTQIDNKEKLNCLLHFVEVFGSWVNKGLDIAQMALQEFPNSYINRSGQDLAKKRRDHCCYVTFPFGPHNKERIVPQMVNIKKDISTVCFTDSPHFILIGTFQGNIELWDLRSKSIKRKYNEHTGYISKLKIDTTASSFLSCSYDNTVRVWRLVTGTLSGDHTPPPSERQENYSEFWPMQMEKIGEKSERILQHHGLVEWAAFAQSPSSNVIASVTHSSMITVWSGTTMKWSLLETGAKTCELCNKDQWVVVGGQNRVTLYSINTSARLHSFDWKVNFLYTIPENLGGGLLMVSEDRVDVWGLSDVEPGVVPSKISDDENYNCCAVNYVIALGTTKNRVRVCHRHTGQTLKEFSESRVGANLVDISIIEGALVTAFSDKTLFVWPLEDVVLPVSAICWPSDATIPFISKVSNGNMIQIFKGREVISEIPVDGEILKLSLSPNADYIAYETANNKLINIANSSTKKILEFDVNLKYTKEFYLLSHKERLIIVTYSERSPVHVRFSDRNEMIELGDESIRCNTITLASNDELLLITVSSAFGIHLWDLETGLLVKTITGQKIPRTELFSISFNKTIIAVVENKFLHIIDLKNNIKLHQFREITSIVCCTLSPNGRTVAFALESNTFVVYNLDTKQRIEHPWTRKLNYKELKIALSDNGILCVATSEPIVEIFTKDLPPSSVVLYVTSIIASPNNPQQFAALDNCGELHILQICDNSVTIKI